MYNPRLVGSRRALSGDTVSVHLPDGDPFSAIVITDGCQRSLVETAAPPESGASRERLWVANDTITLVRSHPRNRDYRS